MVWGLFAAAIAVAQGSGSFAGSRPADLPQTASLSEATTAAPVMTGRSSARSVTGPYGNLFIDPSLQDAPSIQGPKPTSADLLAK